VHPGAVYLHQGRAYVVDELDTADAVALVHAESPPWTTTARDITDIAVVEAHAVRRFGALTVSVGTVDVTNQVVSYVRRRLGSGELLDETPLELPARQLRTTAVWYSLTQDALDAVGLDVSAVPGAAHAAEHAAIGLLPLFATCDRWDIGGVSTALHPDTGRPTVFVYDGAAGGSGFAERGHATLRAWLSATRQAVGACECLAGCPSCVQSPKCGNGNDPLDKAGALRLLDVVLAAVSGWPASGGRSGEEQHPVGRDG
jgi:DEAD/DEAH box helicase domain-containing protein